MTGGLPRYLSVIGLGFGDCGKGLFTDYLCRTSRAHTVVRFNGGAQAGHNVVLPDGRHHTFSQFSSGTFIEGVHTVLASPVVIHPTALLVENDALRSAGVSDAVRRLLIDARCRVITPFHQAAGRLREIVRGDEAHGSCGVGFGEAVKDSLEHPDESLTYGDLAETASALAKLESVRQRLLDEFRSADMPDQRASDEMRILESGSVSRRWLEIAAALLPLSPPAPAARIAERLHLPGSVVFEGAQGMLLDERWGFHPHTTWSSVGADALDRLSREWDLPEPIVHFGAIRSYLTRHGAGPFPTRDDALCALAEAHNGSQGWQGDFRRGHPDALLLRYALRHAGRIEGLLVSHLDVFENGRTLKWCAGYETPSGRVRDLSLCGANSLDQQASLTDLLFSAKPVYDARAISSAEDYLERLTSAAGIAALFGSYGPVASSVSPLSPSFPR